MWSISKRCKRFDATFKKCLLASGLHVFIRPSSVFSRRIPGKVGRSNAQKRNESQTFVGKKNDRFRFFSQRHIFLGTVGLWWNYSEEFKVVAESVGEWGEKIYEEEVFPRKDYRELLELSLVYPFSLWKPGFRSLNLFLKLLHKYSYIL